MPKVTSRVDRILRVYCANRGCTARYDYIGHKSESGAAADAIEHGWGQHITRQMQCPEHKGRTLVTSVEMGD
jgi:hypothetical protein